MLPCYGQTGVSGVGRTASGISMLMSAANGSIRNVIKNVDDYMLKPLGKAFFNFNMQFDFDPEIKSFSFFLKLVKYFLLRFENKHLFCINRI